MDTKITREDVSLLTTLRQLMLENIATEGKTLSRIVSQLESRPSIVFDNLEILQRIHLVQKDENKVYSLTEKGKKLLEWLNEK